MAGDIPRIGQLLNLGLYAQALDNTGGITPPRDRRKMSTGRMRNKASEFFDNGIGSDVLWEGGSVNSQGEFLNQPAQAMNLRGNVSGRAGLRQRARALIKGRY